MSAVTVVVARRAEHAVDVPQPVSVPLNAACAVKAVRNATATEMEYANDNQIHPGR